MWKCAVCEEGVEEEAWDVCWNCSAPRTPPNVGVYRLRGHHPVSLTKARHCGACGTPLQFTGTKRFHEGSRWGFWLGHVIELFANRESYDVYVCADCGKVEFYQPRAT